MKNISLIYSGIMVALLFQLWGCEDSPKPQISETQQILEDARQSGAGEAAPELLREAENYFQDAINELQVQDDQFSLFRDYSKAEELLEKTKVAASQAKTKVQAQIDLNAEQVGKDTAGEKEDVIRAITEARSMVGKAKELLIQAPPGKDVELVLQMMENDLHTAESMLAEIPAELNPQDYAMVKEKAGKAHDVASRVQEQILNAIEKAQGGKQS